MRAVTLRKRNRNGPRLGPGDRVRRLSSGEASAELGVTPGEHVGAGLVAARARYAILGDRLREALGVVATDDVEQNPEYLLTMLVGQRDAARHRSESLEAANAQLASRVGELEEALLAAGRLMFPGEDWGPNPDGVPLASYEDHLSEEVYGEATAVRDAWKARGWRRG